MSSSSEGLVPLLYEELLIDLRRAATQISNRDIEGKTRSLGRASEIVFELLSALDFEAGGEIASRLAALYAYFVTEIGEIGRNLDGERLDRLTEMVRSLHEAWAQAAAAAPGDGAEAPTGVGSIA